MEKVEISTEGGRSMKVPIDELSRVSPGVTKVFKEEQEVKQVSVEFEDSATMTFTKIQ